MLAYMLYIGLCIAKPKHCLHELLFSYPQQSDSLRGRGTHDFVLPVHVCSSN